MPTNNWCGTLLGKTVAWSSATPDSCYAVAAATYMPADQVYLLPQTPLLSNMPTG